MQHTAVCVISGGMDSATAAYLAKTMGYQIIALHFDYKQRTMDKEKQCFNRLCDDLGVAQKIVLDVDFIAQIGGNALTDTNLPIRQHSLDKDILPNSYVPFRNGIFLSIAAALAQKENAHDIFIGVVEEDSSGYPDCSENFLVQINQAINTGTGETINIHSPLVHLSKAQIVRKAIELGVPLQHTWSCYQNQDVPCGACDSCLLRQQGFRLANSIDPIYSV